MAGSRQHDPDATVTNRLARTRGIQNQADLDEQRRDLTRVADVGDKPNEDLEGPVNIGGDLTVRQGDVHLEVNETGRSVRVGPVNDPSGLIDANLFRFVVAGAGEVVLIGYDDVGQEVLRLSLGEMSHFSTYGLMFRDASTAITATIDAETGNISTVGEIAGKSSLVSDADLWQAGYHSDPGANTLSTVGLPAPTTAGTLSNFTVADGPGLTFTTTAVLNNVARVQTGAYWQTRWGIDAVFKIRTGTDVTNLLYHVGLYVSDPSGSGTPNIEYVGFRFDTGFPDTTWLCRSCAGAGVTTTVNSGVAVAANTTYTLRIVSEDGTSFDFFINGALVGTIATNVPATSTLLAAHALVKTLAAETNALRVHHFKMLSR